MKIRIKHNNTEIVVDEESQESTIKYSINEIIKLIGECADKIKEIENNYNQTFEGDDK